MTLRFIRFMAVLKWTSLSFLSTFKAIAFDQHLFFCHAMQPSLVFHIVPSSNYIQFLIFALRDKKKLYKWGVTFFHHRMEIEGFWPVIYSNFEMVSSVFFDLIKCILAKLSMPKGSKMWNKSDVAQKKGVEKNVSVSLSIAPIDFWMTCNEYDVFSSVLDFYVGISLENVYGHFL